MLKFNTMQTGVRGSMMQIEHCRCRCLMRDEFGSFHHGKRPNRERLISIVVGGTEAGAQRMTETRDGLLKNFE